MEKPLNKLESPFGIPRFVDYAYTLFVSRVDVAFVSAKKLVFSAELVNTAETSVRFHLNGMRLIHRSQGVPILIPVKDFREQTGILGRGMTANVDLPPTDINVADGMNHFKLAIDVSYGHPEHAFSRKVEFAIDLVAEFRRPPAQNSLQFSIEKHEDSALTLAGAERLTKNEEQNQS